MSNKGTVKLSSLSPDTLISYEDAHYTLTPTELQRAILNGEERADRKWYVAKEHRWSPSAKFIVETFIENEYDNMYEGWEDRAKDCLTQDHYDKIQAVLNDAFSSDHATKYWLLDGPEVEIDVQVTNIR